MTQHGIWTSLKIPSNNATNHERIIQNMQVLIYLLVLSLHLSFLVAYNLINRHLYIIIIIISFIDFFYSIKIHLHFPSLIPLSIFTWTEAPYFPLSLIKYFSVLIKSKRIILFCTLQINYFEGEGTIFKVEMCENCFHYSLLHITFVVLDSPLKFEGI